MAFRGRKEHLSDFSGWDQKNHAGEYMLLEKNMGTHLSIDESMLHNDLFTFLSNKEGHGKQGSLIAATKGTTISEVTKHLAKIPEKSRLRELIAVRDTIKSKEEYVLNYFNNRSTNAATESLNSKKKGFRAQVRGVLDLPFIMYRMMKIFG